MTVARLRRSDPAAPGYRRVKSGRGFRYLDERGDALEDETSLIRIAELAIPPAWTDVWISPWQNGHIQATGTDAAGRRQYLYHERWRLHRDRVKFDRAVQLAGSLPAARRIVTRALRNGGLTRERVLACAFRILDVAAIRVGSEQYLAENGSHGLSTLLCEHAALDGDVVLLSFPAKSGTRWESEVEDAELAEAIRDLTHGRTGRLLAWCDDDEWHPLSAAEVNDYVRERTHGDFTAKDFRTLRGCLIAATCLRDLGTAATVSASKRNIAAAMRAVADALGNTPAMARKSYVDPRILDRYRSGTLIGSSGSPEAALRELLS